MAVFREIRASGAHELRFWCDRSFGPKAKGIVHHFDASIPVEYIVAGKLRRYHGQSAWQQLRPSILLPNLRDFLKVLLGFVQSFVKLLRWRPDVIFIKGGYVCLPVGYAARLLNIPLVLHDSDAHPGLTNRLLAPFARRIATGAPLEYYRYPQDKARYVGIPVAPEFRPYSEAERRALKQRLKFPEDRPLVVVTGGGLGAMRINEAVATTRDQLLERGSVFLISGTHQYDELRSRLDDREGWRLAAFIHKDMAMVLAAADIVVARAGATTLLELAALAKPTIIIPNGRLTAGHQLKNAKVYQDALAAIVLEEEALLERPELLVQTIDHLLKAPRIRRDLSRRFAAYAKPQAAQDMAQIILTEARRSRRRR